MDGSNDTSFLVYEYSQRKVLAKLGFTTDLNDLNVYESEAFNLIASEFSKLEHDEMKRSRKN